MTALVSLLLAASPAHAADIRRCSDEPRAGDVAWAVTRTVEIRTPDGTGAGALVSPDGFVLTAAHVVGDDPLVSVAWSGGVEPGRVVRRDTVSDLALIRLDGSHYPCFAASDLLPPVGGEVLVIGSPAGELTSSVSKGIVSGVRSIGGIPLVQTDAEVNPGNSGGPLVHDGQVVGIVSFELVGDGYAGLGFAVATATVPTTLGVEWADRTASDLTFRPPPGTGPSDLRIASARQPDPDVFSAWQRHPYAAVRVIAGGTPDLYGASGSLYAARPLALEVGVSRQSPSVASYYARTGLGLSLREKRGVADGVAGKVDHAPRYPSFDVLVEPMGGVRVLEDHRGPESVEQIGASLVTAVDLMIWCDSRAAIDFQLTTGGTWWIEGPEDLPQTMPELRFAAGMAF
jgi:hypothetical protein